jgi:hypothetical protein
MLYISISNGWEKIPQRTQWRSDIYSHKSTDANSSNAVSSSQNVLKVRQVRKEMRQTTQQIDLTRTSMYQVRGKKKICDIKA